VTTSARYLEGRNIHTHPTSLTESIFDGTE
jgi:hypothetical protein